MTSLFAHGLVDGLLEAAVLPSFTALGLQVRGRVDGRFRGALPRLEGRRVVVTGATSGLGAATAQGLAALGAEVVLVGRDRARGEKVLETLSRAGGRGSLVLGDVGTQAGIAAIVAGLSVHDAPIHALIHNAGALDERYTRTEDGLERTVATHLAGPWALTAQLTARLRGGKVVFVSSGGMYAAPLSVAALKAVPPPGARFDGVATYAAVKRAQLAALPALAARLAPAEIFVAAMHPGWVDTPGVTRALPRFHALTGPLLRTPAEGADTLLWLTATDGLPSGRFFHDRRERPVHRLPSTRAAESPAAIGELLAWLDEVARAFQGPVGATERLPAP